MVPGKPPVVVPVRWDARGATVLGREPGTAFAIARNGTTVGALAHGGGFVARGAAAADPALDALVSGTDVPIRAACAIISAARPIVPPALPRAGLACDGVACCTRGAPLALGIQRFADRSCLPSRRHLADGNTRKA